MWMIVSMEFVSLEGSFPPTKKKICTSPFIKCLHERAGCISGMFISSIRIFSAPNLSSNSNYRMETLRTPLPVVVETSTR